MLMNKDEFWYNVEVHWLSNGFLSRYSAKWCFERYFIVKCRNNNTDLFTYVKINIIYRGQYFPFYFIFVLVWSFIISFIWSLCVRTALDLASILSHYHRGCIENYLSSNYTCTSFTKQFLKPHRLSSSEAWKIPV